MPRLLGLAQASKMFRQQPSAARLHALQRQRQRGRLRHHRRRQHQRRTVLGGHECRRCAAGAHGHERVGRWLGHQREQGPTRPPRAASARCSQGFQKEEGTNGIRIHTVKGWDYAALNKTYEEAIATCREEHVPCLIHVEEVTQPQGHSTSGSHERYKSTELLEWYKELDCNVKFREWILAFKPGGDAHRHGGRAGCDREAGQGRCTRRAESRMGRLPGTDQGRDGTKWSRWWRPCRVRWRRQRSLQGTAQRHGPRAQGHPEHRPTRR